jgi:TRAP-type C4-dicarboxylate transport system permease small subunit
VVPSLRRLSDGADRVARILLVPIGIAFILVVFLGVLTRYVLHAPIVSSIELARISFVWAAFLGASICFKGEKHTQFSFLLDALSGRARAMLKVGIALLSVGFFAFLAVKGAQMTHLVQASYFPALGWSQLWLYLPLPVCAAFMLCHALAFLARDLHALAQGGGPGGAA